MVKEFRLYDLCINETAKFLKNNYWNLNYDAYNNPFSILPSSIIDDLIVHVVRLSDLETLHSSELHLLLTSDRVQNFKLEGVSVNAEDLEYILTDLSSSCKNLISIKIKNVFCSHTYRMNLKTYALEHLLLRAQKLESVESCIEFNLSVLCNCFNLKQIILDFPVENHLFDFLEVDGQMTSNNSLRVLEVYEDVRHSVPFLDVAVILRYCSELVEINCDISKGLGYLHSAELCDGTLATHYKLEKCSLGSIYLDAKDATATRDEIYIAALTCPYLREVDVLVKDYSAIHALSDFQRLTSLLIQWEVMQGGDYHSGIHPLLEKSVFGHQLKSLHIMHFSNIDFSLIGTSCPNLEELRVEFLSEVGRPTFSPTSFQKLVYLHVENISDENCNDRSLVGMLSNAINLKFLVIFSAGLFTDFVLAEILSKNKLSLVKELRMSNCVLSIQGLQNLASSLTALEYFELSSSEIIDFAATAIHEINPRIILSSAVSDM